MSQPAVAALAPLPFELVYSDGEPLDSNWERIQINRLIDAIHQAMEERGRTDYFAGGNMFVYYSYEQAREVAADFASERSHRHFRGPDVFFVGGVRGGDRKYWAAWEEDGRHPEVIVEFLSRSTEKIDRTVKKDLYARTFRTSEYFLFHPETLRFDGFRLEGDMYKPIVPTPQGRLWSEQLGLYLGPWHGVQTKVEATWVRLFHPDGTLVPTAEERAAAAEARAAAAEAELERLRRRLGDV
jgi:Uma2 family endonuclease